MKNRWAFDLGCRTGMNKFALSSLAEALVPLAGGAAAITPFDDPELETRRRYLRTILRGALYGTVGAVGLGHLGSRAGTELGRIAVSRGLLKSPRIIPTLRTIGGVGGIVHGTAGGAGLAGMREEQLARKERNEEKSAPVSRKKEKGDSR